MFSNSDPTTIMLYHLLLLVIAVAIVLVIAVAIVAWIIKGLPPLVIVKQIPRERFPPQSFYEILKPAVRQTARIEAYYAIQQHIARAHDGKVNGP